MAFDEEWNRHGATLEEVRRRIARQQHQNEVEPAQGGPQNDVVNQFDALIDAVKWVTTNSLNLSYFCWKTFEACSWQNIVAMVFLLLGLCTIYGSPDTQHHVVSVVHFLPQERTAYVPLQEKDLNMDFMEKRFRAATVFMSYVDGCIYGASLSVNTGDGVINPDKMDSFMHMAQAVQTQAETQHSKLKNESKAYMIECVDKKAEQIAELANQIIPVSVFKNATDPKERGVTAVNAITEDISKCLPRVMLVHFIAICGSWMVTIVVHVAILFLFGVSVRLIVNKNALCAVVAGVFAGILIMLLAFEKVPQMKNLVDFTKPLEDHLVGELEVNLDKTTQNLATELLDLVTFGATVIGDLKSATDSQQAWAIFSNLPTCSGDIDMPTWKENLATPVGIPGTAIVSSRDAQRSDPSWDHAGQFILEDDNALKKFACVAESVFSFIRHAQPLGDLCSKIVKLMSYPGTREYLTPDFTDELSKDTRVRNRNTLRKLLSSVHNQCHDVNNGIRRMKAMPSENIDGAVSLWGNAELLWHIKPHEKNFDEARIDAVNRIMKTAQHAEVEFCKQTAKDIIDQDLQTKFSQMIRKHKQSGIVRGQLYTSSTDSVPT